MAGLTFSSKGERERGREQGERGDHAEAARSFERVADMDPGDVEVAMRLAYHHLHSGHPSAAASVYARIATLHAGTGQRRRSLMLARRAHEIDPDRSTVARLGAWARLAGPIAAAVLCDAAEHQREHGKPERARELLRLAADLDPARVAVCNRLVELELELGDPDAARDRLDIAGRRLLAQGRMAEFVPVAERLLALAPSHALFLRTVVDVYLRTGRSRDAIPRLHALLRAAPGDPSPLVTLAQLHAGLRQRKAALAALARWVWLRYRLDGESARAEIDRVLDRSHRWWPGDVRFVQGIVDLGLFGPEPEGTAGTDDLELVFLRIQPPPPPPEHARVA